MSRSYKKPYVKSGCCKGGKRAANKKVRKYRITLNGGLFKKLYESWNIVDYKVYYDVPKNRRK